MLIFQVSPRVVPVVKTIVHLARTKGRPSTVVRVARREKLLEVLHGPRFQIGHARAVLPGQAPDPGEVALVLEIRASVLSGRLLARRGAQVPPQGVVRRAQVRVQGRALEVGRVRAVRVSVPLDRRLSARWNVVPVETPSGQTATA